MRRNVTLVLTCILGNCLAETPQGTHGPAFPSRTFIEKEFRRALLQGWQVLSVQEGAVPSDWFSLDRTGVLIVAGSGAERLSMCVVPREWIGVRKVEHQGFLDCRKGLQIAHGFKAVTAAPDEKTRDAVWRAMGLSHTSS